MTIDQQTGLYGTYDFVYTPWWQKPQYFIPVLFVAVLILIILSYFFYKILTNIVNYYTPSLVKAKKALKNLEKKKTIDIVDLAQEIQRIIKEYITKTYGITIASFTPHECSLFLQRNVHDQSDKEAIHHFFTTLESLLFIKKEQIVQKRELIAAAVAVLEIEEKQSTDFGAKI